MSAVRSGVLAALLAVGVITVPTSMPAHAVPAPTDCPDAFPTAQAVDGVVGTGYTVERGVTPEPFSATVLGRIDDGIAPGVDMIMADLSSPALTRAGGVWAGMSGSPVYAADGRLIGSVAYGLAANSPIAGITPAAEMTKLLALPAAAGASRPVITVSKEAAARVAKTGDASRAEVLDGFARLPVPITVSGAHRRHVIRQLNRLRTALPGAHLRGGPSAAGTAAEPAGITAGGNIGVAISYGTATLAAVGTTTFVCDGKAVAFGHPFLHSGAANQFSAHTATAVYVQPDAASGPFKVANFGGVVGTVDQDRLAGMRAGLGAAPGTAVVATGFSVEGAPKQTLKTTAVAQQLMSTIAFNHVMVAVDKGLDSVGQGSAAFTIRVQGTRGKGTPFVIRRSDRMTRSGAEADLSYDLGVYVAGVVNGVASRSTGNVRITSVAVGGTISPSATKYR